MKISYIVKPNDSLWNIAKNLLGDPEKWEDIWAENSQISNPDIIHPGDVLKVDVSNHERWYSLWAGQ